jgi:hypothetical protein
MDSILPWLISAITIMPFFVISVLTALVTCSNDLSDATVTRSPLNDVFEPAKLRPTLAAPTIAASTILRNETVEFIC